MSILTSVPLIRPAQPTDVAAIAALLTDAVTADPVAVWHHHPASETALLEHYHRGLFTGLALSRFQRLHTLLRRYRRDTSHHRLVGLHVAPDARRRGAGS